MDAREFEVRCAHCNAGFAAGTRVCVHCQRRLGRADAVAWPVPEGVWPGAEGRQDADAHEPDEEGGPRTGSGWARVAPGLLTLLFVALGIVSRMCSGAHAGH